MKYYGWKSFNDMMVSFAPSIKYNITLKLISISSVIAFFETSLFGLKFETLMALVILLTIELFSGIYCSNHIRKEKFESAKMWRFFFKSGMFFIITYVMYQLQKEFVGRIVLEEIFTFVYNGLLAFSILEIIISVMENYAEIEGKKKDYYTSFITTKINKIFGKDDENNTPTTDSTPV